MDNNLDDLPESQLIEFKMRCVHCGEHVIVPFKKSTGQIIMNIFPETFRTGADLMVRFICPKCDKFSYVGLV